MTSGAVDQENTPAPTRARPLVASLVVVSWAIGVGLILVTAWTQVPESADVATVATTVAAVFATVSALTAGAILILRVPRHPIGWLLWGSGMLLAISFAGPTAVPTTGAAAVWVAWISQFGWDPAIAGLGLFVPLMFPTGNLPSPRWRAVVAAAAIAIALSTAQDAFGSGSVTVGTQQVPNPLGASGPAADLLALGNDLSTLVGVVCFLLMGASLVRRYRRSTGVERQQLKWFAAAGGLTAVAFAIAISTSIARNPVADGIGAVAWPMALVGFGLIPVAIGIAVLRYRLYDIDVILRRTAVYLPLTAILAGLYAASIALLQRLFVVVTGNPSDGAVILSTLVLATVFTPIKSSLQSWVDGTFRDARDAERRLHEFVDAVEDSLFVPAADRVLRGFLHVVIGVTHAAGGAAYAASSGAEHLVAETADRRAGPTTVVDVAADGTVVGRLVLDPRRNGAALRPHDLAAVAAAADRLVTAMGPAIAGSRVPAAVPTSVPQVALDAAD